MYHTKIMCVLVRCSLVLAATSLQRAYHADLLAPAYSPRPRHSC
jgi:hypothetical protein